MEGGHADVSSKVLEIHALILSMCSQLWWWWWGVHVAGMQNERFDVGPILQM